MNAERYRTASAIFHAALEVADDRRAAFLADACGDDHELRHEVDTLLSAHRDAGSFLGRPALEVAATVAAGPAFAPGSTIGVYEVRALLGVGGMGEVYRATDSRLRRDVALKVLPHRFRFDAERRARFEREAQVLASLNHPNIATLLGIEDADGVQALVMEHVEGDSLDHRIGISRARVAGAPRPLAPQEALAIAAQLVDALEFAHGRGIVHRDLKPANIKIRPDGTVKVLDFGLAKAFGFDRVAGVNDATITVADAGLVLGTPAYMSPEQARGGAVDSRSDVWAFGCVLFEMLTGQPAFGGDSAAAVIAAILERDPDFATLPPNTPPSIRRLLERTLARNPNNRLHHIRDARFEIREARSAMDARTSPSSSNDAASHPAVATAPPRPVWTSGRLAIAVLLVVATALGAVVWKRASDQRWARTVAIPEVGRLVEAENFSAAFALADKADDYVADDPMLRSLAPQFTMTVTITSTPPGAKVYVRGYDATDAQWQYLGLTPLEKVSLPRETMRWSLKKDGFEETELATKSSVGLVTAILNRVGQRPAEMVRVPGEKKSRRLVNGTFLNNDGVVIPPFFLDRTEVTNKAFKEFVDADGYAQPSFWDGLDFSRNGVARLWTDAVKEFVDTTGKPGPKTWEFGDYPKGHDDYPVTGVSWYEAMAYARFRGKTLPSIYHWANAAVSNTEGGRGLSPWIVPLSNYSGMGSSPVRTYQGMSPFGTFDMAGNVREWILNQEQRARQPVAIGGSWRDPNYIFSFAQALDPSDRSDVNGFRLMRQIEGEPRAVKLEEPFLLPGRSYVGEQPVPDDIFAAYAGQYEYQPGDLRASPVEIVETTSEWRKERVEIDTGYGERMEVYLWVPINGRPPFQPLIYFPLVRSVHGPRGGPQHPARLPNLAAGFHHEVGPCAGAADLQGVLRTVLRSNRKKDLVYAGHDRSTVGHESHPRLPREPPR